MNDEAGSGLGLPLQRSADGFQALAHAAQAVAFGGVRTAAIVGNFQRAEIVLALQSDAAASSLRVPHDVRHRLA